MNKRKLLTIAMSLSMVAILAVGATIAYFTDTAEEIENVFSIGNIDISLTETVAANELADVEDTDNGASYTNIMPGAELTKKPVVTNDGDYDAYVRVAVRVANYDATNKAIDDVYEKAGKTDAEIQAIYDEVFEGWDMQYLHAPNVEKAASEPNVRHWLNKTDALRVDYAIKIDENYTLFDTSNWFQTQVERDSHDRAVEDYEGGPDAGYYTNGLGTDYSIYVFYLKLGAGESYTLFEGLNCPKDFTQEQAAMFSNLYIYIDAAAIQADGFDTAQAAFAELNKQIPVNGVAVEAAPKAE